MKILIIGGKKFLGYHIAQAALSQNHDVLMFNRGQTYPEVLADIPVINGDRNENLSKLKDQSFDVIIDTCAYFPSQVDKVIEHLKGGYKYVLISTLSAVQLKEKGFDETVEIIGLDYESVDVSGGSYGPLKAACEQQVTSKIENHLIIRPGYIVGERDHTDRFTFWPVMMKHLKEMLVPKSDLMYAFIDVKDIADFIIKAIEKDLKGLYHVAGQAVRFSDFLEICQKTVNPTCNLIETRPDYFKEPPVYISYPQYDDIEEGHVLYSANVSKAYNAGLHQRPIEQTLMDALDWFEHYKGKPEDLAAGISIEDLRQLTNDFKKKLTLQ